MTTENEIKFQGQMLYHIVFPKEQHWSIIYLMRFPGVCGWLLAAAFRKKTAAVLQGSRHLRIEQIHIEQMLYYMFNSKITFHCAPSFAQYWRLRSVLLLFPISDSWVKVLTIISSRPG